MSVAVVAVDITLPFLSSTGNIVPADTFLKVTALPSTDGASATSPDVPTNKALQVTKVLSLTVTTVKLLAEAKTFIPIFKSPKS